MSAAFWNGILRQHADAQARVSKAATHERPPEPDRDEGVDYRGWECLYNHEARFWTGEGWEAYRGGCDLEARRVTAYRWDQLLDEIDEEEDA